jgi:hypothetical protein
MRREDWWWLAIRVFALWLVVDGVRMLPWLLATTTLGHDEEKPRWHELLRVIVPIGTGVLLFVEGHRLLPAPRAAAAADTGTGGAAPAHLAATDLFWVCYKIAGLIAAAMGAWFGGVLWLEGASWKDAAAMLPLFAFGLLLLFNDAPFRLAARGRVPR